MKKVLFVFLFSLTLSGCTYTSYSNEEEISDLEYEIEELQECIHDYEDLIQAAKNDIDDILPVLESPEDYDEPFSTAFARTESIYLEKPDSCPISTY